MAWTSTDKELIRQHLGYPVTVQALATIQARMDDLTAISPDSVVTAQSSIAQLVAVDASITAGRDTAAIADTASTTATSYFRGENLRVLREEGARIVRELAEMMGLVVYRDVYAVSNQSSGRTVRS